jgi:hypothetical protein
LGNADGKTGLDAKFAQPAVARANSASGALDKAKEHLKKLQTEFSPDNLWENKIRPGLFL